MSHAAKYGNGQKHFSKETILHLLFFIVFIQDYFERIWNSILTEKWSV